MKQIIISIAIISTIIAGCSKDPSTSMSARSNYVCRCYWKKNPVTDTTAMFVYPGDTAQVAPGAACNYRDTWVKSLAGPSSGANCRLD